MTCPDNKPRQGQHLEVGYKHVYCPHRHKHVTLKHTLAHKRHRKSDVGRNKTREVIMHIKPSVTVGPSLGGSVVRLMLIRETWATRRFLGQRQDCCMSMEASRDQCGREEKKELEHGIDLPRCTEERWEAMRREMVCLGRRWVRQFDRGRSSSRWMETMTWDASYTFLL